MYKRGKAGGTSHQKPKGPVSKSPKYAEARGSLRERWIAMLDLPDDIDQQALDEIIKSRTESIARTSTRPPRG